VLIQGLLLLYPLGVSDEFSFRTCILGSLVKLSLRLFISHFINPQMSFNDRIACWASIFQALLEGRKCGSVSFQICTGSAWRATQSCCLSIPRHAQVVEATFGVWGLQTKVENFIHKV